jgi:hypothetical protein
MNRRSVFAAFVAVTGVLGVMASPTARAEPITVMRIERLLRDAPRGTVRFRESRQSPWLAAPVVSSGTLRSDATMLEKVIEQPRRETWQILSDRMQRVAPDGSVAPLLFSDAPAVAALAIALRRLMAGELTALESDFRLSPAGDDRSWTLQLTPREARVARILRTLEVQGSGRFLQAVVILETQGDRTVMRMDPQP